jgi:CRISPR-associated protein Cmr4
MYKLAKPLFIHCVTPMHAGSGDDLGVVDLPIQRESHTDFPKIEASSLKGAIRESFEEMAKDTTAQSKVHIAFGYDDDGTSEEVKKIFLSSKERDFAGALGFSDARLLLFPLKSMKGIYAFATSPQILQRFKSELSDICEPKQPVNVDMAFNFGESQVLLASSDPLSLTNGKVQLEEYSFDAMVDDIVTKLANVLVTLTGIEDLANRLVIIPDDVFTYFVKTATEVVTRIKIDNATGTVASGALFTEEYLPAESVLYSLVLASDVFAPKSKDYFPEGSANEIMNYVETIKPVIQIGGNATLGKGIVKTKLN